MNLPKALLWDMDGTLIDSEVYWVNAQVALAQAHGRPYERRQSLEFIGKPISDSAQIYVRVTGIELTPAQVSEAWCRSVENAIIEQGVPWRPGALELLSAARERGVAQGLVTSSYTRLAQLTASAVPGGMDVVVTGDSVARLKPDPECYLTACESLGVEPAQTVGFEDSGSGVGALLAAGVNAVCIPYMVPISAHPRLSRLRSLTEVDLGVLGRLAAGEVIDHFEANAAAGGHH
ncbi:MAG: HAD family phosphatase [Buchananella hordeovulneris]|nr:HAD family phosphatase [Buchananella hordeovulneris]